MNIIKQIMDELQGDQLVTYALWGSGSLDARSAEAVMSEYIPDPGALGFVYRPDRITRDMPGLRVAMDWFESPSFAGAGATTPSTDLLASLLESRAEHGDHVALLALWPESPTREDFAYIRSFQAEGIYVADLSRTLDELDLSLYTEPDPPKEPRAAKPKAPARTRKISDPEPEAFTSPSMESAGSETVVTTEPLVCEPIVDTTIADVYQELAEVVGVDAARLIDDLINAKIRTAMVHRTEPVAASDTQRMLDPYDPAPFDGPYVDVDTEPYYRNSSMQIRPAVGKPRRGETVMNLTPEEVEAAKQEGRYRA